MPAERKVHLNVDNDVRLTRCGRLLRKVKHTTDEKDVTCDMCARLAKREER
jgi:hypothetical protein